MSCYIELVKARNPREALKKKKEPKQNIEQQQENWKWESNQDRKKEAKSNREQEQENWKWESNQDPYLVFTTV